VQLPLLPSSSRVAERKKQMVMWSEQAANSSQQGPNLVRSSLLQNVPNAILNNTSQTYKVAIPNQTTYMKSTKKS
jgi:hypothetical protein